MKPLRLTSLFAGIGGFERAFKRHGVRAVCSVEKNVNCRHVLRRHFPETLLLDDVCSAGRDNIPDSDILSFGWPCQDLSSAGLRRGFNGDKSVLYFEALRITDEKRPLAIVWENVPGLLSSCSCRECGRRCAECGEVAGADDEQCAVCGSDKLRGRVLQAHRGADLYAVVSSLNIIGYSGAWTLLDARYFGVPQRRQRLFGVFTRLDSGAERCGEILSLASRLHWNPEAGRQEGQIVAGTLTHSARKSSPNGGNAGMLVAGTVGTKTRSPSGDEARQGLLVASTIVAGNGHAGISDGVPANLIAGTVSAKWKKGTGGPAGDECQNLVKAYRTAGDGGVYEHGNHTAPLQTGTCPTAQIVAGPLAVNIAQITSRENRSNPQPGDPSPTIDTDGRIHVAGAIRRHHGGSNGKGTLDDGTTHALDTLGGSAVAFSGRARGDDGRGHARPPHVTGDVTGALDTVKPWNVATDSAVRRLTPRETERLQGYDDDWTAFGIDEAGERVEMADTVRYEMTGNSVAVPCVDWIAGRLIDELRRSKSTR